MPTVIFRHSDGREEVIEVESGTTVMRAATANGIDGIVAECGGALSCATCHVFVDERFLDKLPPISEGEAQMLEFTSAERRPNSRLSCQLELTPAVDGMIVEIADPQT